MGNLSSFGNVIAVPVPLVVPAQNVYHVECAIPTIGTAMLLTVSLYKVTGQLYPFFGFVGGNIVTVQYYWANTTQTQTPGGNISVSGVGFNTLGPVVYCCQYTGPMNSSLNTTFLSFNRTASSLTYLNCGPTPTATFQVIAGKITVSLAIFEGNVSGYNVQPLSTSFVTYNACLDLIVDGDETDVDCGGISPKHTRTQNCN